MLFSVAMSLISTTSKLTVVKSSATASTLLTFLSAADIPFFQPYEFGLRAAFVFVMYSLAMIQSDRTERSVLVCHRCDISVVGLGMSPFSIHATFHIDCKASESWRTSLTRLHVPAMVQRSCECAGVKEQWDTDLQEK